eukprot:365940-Chlamydomonas_euryale.AAC.31
MSSAPPRLSHTPPPVPAAGPSACAEMSSALLWQVIRGGTCFTRRGLHGESFSSEAGNLKNKHCYKYSGASGSIAVLA